MARPAERGLGSSLLSLGETLSYPPCHTLQQQGKGSATASALTTTGNFSGLEVILQGYKDQRDSPIYLYHCACDSHDPWMRVLSLRETRGKGGSLDKANREIGRNQI